MGRTLDDSKRRCRRLASAAAYTYGVVHLPTSCLPPTLGAQNPRRFPQKPVVRVHVVDPRFRSRTRSIPPLLERRGLPRVLDNPVECGVVVRRVVVEADEPRFTPAAAKVSVCP